MELTLNIITTFCTVITTIFSLCEIKNQEYWKCEAPPFLAAQEKVRNIENRIIICYI